jgi:hypothetical protein
MRSFTKTEVYALPTLALIIGIVALVILVLANQSNDDAKLQIESIASENGFEGSLNNDDELNLSLTTTGLLFGQSGAIFSAPDSAITATLLTNFDNRLTGTPITASDSILTSLQKCAVLKQTKMINFVSSTGIITPEDSSFEAIQKLQGNILFAPHIFSVSSGSVIANNDFETLWSEEMFGSPEFPPNSLFVGTVIEVRTYGEIIITAGTNIAILQCDFGGSQYELKTGTLQVGQYPFNFNSLLRFSMTGVKTYCDSVHTLSLDKYSAVNNNYSTSLGTKKVINLGVAHVMSFSGKFMNSSSADSITINNTIGSYVFRT